MGNYVIAVGNYVIVTPSQLGNYKIADTEAFCYLRLSTVAAQVAKCHDNGLVKTEARRPVSLSCLGGCLPDYFTEV